MVHYFLHNYPFCAYVAPKYTILYIYQKSSFYAYVCTDRPTGIGICSRFLRCIMDIRVYILRDKNWVFFFFFFYTRSCILSPSFLCIFYITRLLFLFSFIPWKTFPSCIESFALYSSTFFSTYLFLKSKFRYYIV